MGVKISELNEASSVQNSDVLPIVQEGETKKISVETLGSQKVNKSGDTMTGDLNMQGNSVKFGNDGNIQWKEDGSGDKFRIIPDFNGSGSDNKLIIQSTIGDAGTDPQNWKDLVYIHADNGYIDLVGNIGSKSQITYDSWHSIVLTRSDSTWLNIMLYGTDLLKQGIYSIANDFKIVTSGALNSELTIPRSAIKEINRKDWGFELIAKRSEISGDSGGGYNGIAIVSDGNLTLQST